MNKNKTRHRQRAQKSGQRAEALAALYLRLKAYRVIARNFRHPAGEIDIVAVRGPVIIFVEVKHRGAGPAGLEAVTPRQWQRIGVAARVLSGAMKACKNYLGALILSVWAGLVGRII